MSGKLRAALYLRVSTAGRTRRGDQLEYDQHPELQEAPLRRLAEQRGWTVAAVYTDRASGSNDRRPALDEMLRAARKRRFDVLMVWRFDRLSRSTLHFLHLVDELRSLGIEFVSHEQTFDTTTPMGKFALTLFAALAELERQVIRERVIAGMEYARTRGTKFGRPRRAIDRVQVVELREQGLSWRQIADKLGAGVGTVRRAYSGQRAASEVCQNPKEKTL